MKLSLVDRMSGITFFSPPTAVFHNDVDGLHAHVRLGPLLLNFFLAALPQYLAPALRTQGFASLGCGPSANATTSGIFLVQFDPKQIS